MTNYLQASLSARVYDVAIETPLQEAPRLSDRLGNTLLLKREDLQSVHSFKIRGAYNKIARLSPEALARGVVCASAGNHAQGVALSASKLGARAVVVMPRTTPQVKVQAVRARGGEVVLQGDSFDEAYAHARGLEEREGLVFVHPFDDPDVIAGQGTIGLEILRQRQDVDAVFVPIGGGGLAAGVAACIKSVRPDIKVIGVEPEDAASMYRSLQAGRRVKLDYAGLFADGVAVREVGEETFRLCREYLDEVVLVNTDAICAAMQDVFDDCRAVLEPAGAVATAGAKAWAKREGVSGRTLVAVASGANVNFDRLRFVAERANVGEHREAVLTVTIPEGPGNLREFCVLVGRRHLTELCYRYADPRRAQLFVGIEVSGRDEAARFTGYFNRQGYEAIDLSDDETAKLHLRHLVGGRAPLAEDEVLYRFEFPERPGALMQFLDALPPRWNISLFHYRNHGSDCGHALVGLQVARADRPTLEAALRTLGYRFHDETDNPGCRLFLRPETAPARESSD